ncbi:MAG: hypothetical protein ACXAB7_11645 [Candidatus Kariarchaeaceae archaeon]|jgi:hypothetical protein
MSLSGIKIMEETIKKYDELRFKKQPGGLILKIEDDQIIIERVVQGSIDSVLADIPESEPRYLLFDIPLKNRAGIDVVKTIFIFWMPMESPVRLRMEYASTKSTITKEFRGIAAQVQEDEKEAINLESLITKINKIQGINAI